MKRSRASASRRGSREAGARQELTPNLFGSERNSTTRFFLQFLDDSGLAAAASGGANAVRADGFVHVVDFARSRSLWPVASKKLFRGWLRRFHVAPRDVAPDIAGAGSRRPGCSL